MANVSVDACGNERRGLFKGKELRVGVARVEWFAAIDQCANAEDKRHDANKKQEPSDELMPRKWIVEPDIDVEQKQRDDKLPREKAIEPMRARRAQRSARNINEQGGRDEKGDEFEHGILKQSRLPIPVSRRFVVRVSSTLVVVG